MKKVLFFLPVLLFSGCATVSSLNVQRSALRSAGDLSATLILETQSAEEIVDQHEAMVDALTRVDQFLSSGECADLPLSHLEQIKQCIPAKFHGLVDAAIASVQSKQVDPEKLGQNNVERIRAYLKGSLMGIQEYRVEDR